MTDGKQVLLWLDDSRDPMKDTEWRVPNMYNWDQIIWCKNYKEFVDYIKGEEDLPDVISFDHDLHKDHYTPEEYWGDYEKSLRYQAIARTESIKKHSKGNQKINRGLECLEFLLDFCDEFGYLTPLILCHSNNPVGKDAINRMWHEHLQNKGVC